MRQAFSPTGTVTRKKEHTVWPRGGQSTTTIPYNSLQFPTIPYNSLQFPIISYHFQSFYTIIFNHFFTILLIE